ncbi:hypothetical protein GCM10028803_11910 [Larkinella knui]
MKTLILFTLLIISASLAFGQCDKEVKLTTTKTEYLNATGAVERTVDETMHR